MRQDEVRQALDDYADRQLAAPRDLWPRVRQAALARRPTAGRIVIEPAGRSAVRLVPTAVVLGLLIVAVLLGSQWLAGPPPRPLATPSPAGTPPPTPLPGAPTALPPLDLTYGQLLAIGFAKRLGVDPLALDAAFAKAASETIDQAVRDGALTPEQAAQAQAATSQGLAVLFARGFADGGANPAPADLNTWLDQWLAETYGVASPTESPTK